MGQLASVCYSATILQNQMDLHVHFLVLWTLPPCFPMHSKCTSFKDLLGERINIRCFLSNGTITGFFACLLCLSYWADIHSSTYLLIVQILAGLSQSTGWPVCASVLGNLVWEQTRHAGNIGNITNALIAGASVEEARFFRLLFQLPSFLNLACFSSCFWFTALILWVVTFQNTQLHICKRIPPRKMLNSEAKKRHDVITLFRNEQPPRTPIRVES